MMRVAMIHAVAESMPPTKLAFQEVFRKPNWSTPWTRGCLSTLAINRRRHCAGV